METTNQQKNINIIKVRDDQEPIKFEAYDNNKDTIKFKVSETAPALWCNEEDFNLSQLRSRVEPWLTSLFQSEHLSLLVGSGLSSAIQYLATTKCSNGMEEYEPKSKYKDKIKNDINERLKKLKRGDKPNIEDYIRVMNELLRGLEILDDKEKDKLQTEIIELLTKFTNNILNIEHSIVRSEKSEKTEQKEDAFNKLVLFLMSFASRTGTRDRLNIFTTNYDRIIEAGADIAGLHLIDRFVGTLSPIFRASRLDIDMHYNPPGIRGEPRYLEGVARYTKLHGSIDWVDIDGSIRKIGVPLGAQNFNSFLEALELKDDTSKIMIYPNSSKDRETSEFPYVELFRDFAAALCRPNSTLVTYGYSFGDDHINRVIKDMLTIPSTHLVIIAYDDANNRIMDLYKRWDRASQMSLIIGPEIANITTLVDYLLPKPAIDKATLRMADLLKQRFVSGDQSQETKHERDNEDAVTTC